MTSLELTCLELCAGGGGQALGLERAGFFPAGLAEIDPDCCATLRANRPYWPVFCTDIMSGGWLDDNVDLIAGGLPCTPHSRGGRQLGQADVRHLWDAALAIISEVRPRAIMLETSNAILSPRFTMERAGTLTMLRRLGYRSTWEVIDVSELGVPQRRRRAVLAAFSDPAAFRGFVWPQPCPAPPPTVGGTLYLLAAANGWAGAQSWAAGAQDIAPTVTGGSTRHGGADLGASQGKTAWRRLGIDPMGIADGPPWPGRQVPPRRGEDRGRRRDRADAHHRDGGPAARVPARLGVLRRQDRAVPADRQRVPATCRRGDRAGDRPGTSASTGDDGMTAATGDGGDHRDYSQYRPWFAWVLRHTRWIPPALMWAGHYFLWLSLPFAALILAGDGTGRPGWLGVLAAAGWFVWFAAVFTDIRYHAPRLCERCMGATPLDPQAAVERWRPALRANHSRWILLGLLIVNLFWTHRHRKPARGRDPRTRPARASRRLGVLPAGHPEPDLPDHLFRPRAGAPRPVSMVPVVQMGGQRWPGGGRPQTRTRTITASGSRRYTARPVACRGGQDQRGAAGTGPGILARLA